MTTNLSTVFFITKLVFTINVIKEVFTMSQQIDDVGCSKRPSRLKLSAENDHLFIKCNVTALLLYFSAYM